MLIEQGYHGTGVKEVLDKVGIPKGSFYNYFESKEQFGAEVIQHYAQQIVENMRAWLGKPKGDALSVLKRFFSPSVGTDLRSQTSECRNGNDERADRT